MATAEKKWREKRHIGTGTFKASPLTYKLVKRVLDSGVISYGVMSKTFEKTFAGMHDCQYSILANSGTSALQVALQTLKELHGWVDGDLVVVPATTFVATANIVHHNRMTPLFVDIEPGTWNINPYKISEAIEEVPAGKVRAIIPVHLLGQSANMSEIGAIAEQYDIKIIEDSCETMFATHFGKPVGSLGDIGCFSTYVAHLIVTGVGGICTTNNPDYAAKIRSLVNHGLELEFLNPNDNFSPQPMIGRRFRFETCGHSFRMTEMEAALGLAQLDISNQILATRRRNAKHLIAGIEHINKHYGNPIHPNIVAKGNTHSWMMFAIVLNPIDGLYADKEPLMTYLNERGIETRDLMPILGQPIYRWLNPDRYPTSKWLTKSGFYVGVHQNLDTSDIQYIIQMLEDYFQARRKD